MDRRDWIPFAVVVMLLTAYICWGLSDPNVDGRAALAFPANVG